MPEDESRVAKREAPRHPTTKVSLRETIRIEQVLISRHLVALRLQKPTELAVIITQEDILRIARIDADEVGQVLRWRGSAKPLEVVERDAAVVVRHDVRTLGVSVAQCLHPVGRQACVDA